MKMNLETLTPDEMDLSALVARERFLRCRANGQRHKYGRKDEDHNVRKEIESVGSEIFAARKLGRTWVDSLKPDPKGDIGDWLQVRHTPRRYGRLLVHTPEQGDDPTHIFFLVVGTFPRYRLVGWLKGSEAQKQQYWKELEPGRPCYAVEPCWLHSPETFV
jgi:hypothetical protein